MSAAEVLRQIEAAGVRVVMLEPGRLRLIGSDEDRAKVKAIVLEHRQEILEHFGFVPAVPVQQPEWTPKPCPRERRHWVPMPGTDYSDCRACPGRRCTMLTVDTIGTLE